jgi:hypothetical protein
MISSGEINGTPVHSKHLITDVPKNELGFEGLLLLTGKIYTYTPDIKLLKIIDRL